MNWMSLKRIERIKSRSWPIMCVSGDKQMRGVGKLLYKI